MDLLSIQMGAEDDTLFINCAEFVQRHHLETPTVSKDVAIPAHPLVQSSPFAQSLVSWLQTEMVSITQKDLTAERLHILSE